MTPINIRTVSTYPLTPIKDVSFISFLLTIIYLFLFFLNKSCTNFLLIKNDVDQEKGLPGVLMTVGSNAGNAFELLYRLEDLDEPK
jgi:hypothetical protein